MDGLPKGPLGRHAGGRAPWGSPQNCDWASGDVGADHHELGAGRSSDTISLPSPGLREASIIFKELHSSAAATYSLPPDGVVRNPQKRARFPLKPSKRRHPATPNSFSMEPNPQVPVRLHRFVRFFLRVSFRFASGPLQASFAAWAVAFGLEACWVGRPAVLVLAVSWMCRAPCISLCRQGCIRSARLLALEVGFQLGLH